MKETKSLHPGWIVLALLLFPPLGLILLGELKTIKPFFKISIAICYGLFFILLIQNYRLVPRTDTSESFQHETEQVQYQYLRAEYPSSLPNGVKEMVQKDDDETWVQVFLTVTNTGKKKIYYISLLDSPVLVTETGTIDPDLSLSFEPFGEISSQETKTGYLVFRVKSGQMPSTFQIGSYSANLR